MLAGSPWPRLRWLTPTVVRRFNPRNRRPSVIASLTEPPLESSTTMAPLRSRPEFFRDIAKSSKSLGVSPVTIPTAATHPQFGSQATQLKRIGSLRSSSVALACAVLPIVKKAPHSAPLIAAPPRSSQRSLRDVNNLTRNPSPCLRANTSIPKFTHNPASPAVPSSLQLVTILSQRC